MYVVESSIGYDIKDSIFDKAGSFEVMTKIFFRRIGMRGNWGWGRIL